MRFVPLGIILALVGYWGPWVDHKAAALVLSGLDMAEFVKFLPEVQAGTELVIRELFYLPLLATALCLALTGGNRCLRYPLWARVVMVIMAIVLTIIVLPPYPFILQALNSEEYRQQFLLGAGCLALIGGTLLYHRLPRVVVAVLLAVVSFAGAIPPAWQFLSVRDALDRVYGQPIQVGWGLWLMVAGFLVVAGTGGWILGAGYQSLGNTMMGEGLRPNPFRLGRRPWRSKTGRLVTSLPIYQSKHGGEKVEEQKRDDMGNVAAETVNIVQGGARSVQGTNVTLRQAGAQSVTADKLVVRQGGVVQAKADHVEMVGGGIALAQTQTASLTASQAGAVLSEGEVRMEQSGARLLLTRGDVTMDQSGAVAMIARNVKTENSGTVFLFASQVEGTVNTAFGPRESVIFGSVAGLVMGLVVLLARLARRKQGATSD